MFQCWAASIVHCLIYHLCCFPFEYCQPVSTGKRVLELGCGAGLLGVVLHILGVGSACLTDGDDQTLRNCLHNLHINGAEVRCSLL